MIHEHSRQESPLRRHVVPERFCQIRNRSVLLAVGKESSVIPSNSRSSTSSLRLSNNDKRASSAVCGLDRSKRSRNYGPRYEAFSAIVHHGQKTPRMIDLHRQASTPHFLPARLRLPRHLRSTLQSSPKQRSSPPAPDRPTHS